MRLGLLATSAALLAPSSAAAATAALPSAPPAGVATMPWPVPSAGAAALNVTLGYGTVASTGTRFSWYSATLDDLARFSVRLPRDGGCTVRAGTTATAAQYNCTVATNAGYFQFAAKPTYCLGEVVSDGAVLQWGADGAPLFGVTADRTSFVGVLERDDVRALNVTHAVSGFGVLVRNGEVHRPGVIAAARAARRWQDYGRARGDGDGDGDGGGGDDDDLAVALAWAAEEIAPRTALALDAAGRLVLVAIDGVEALDLGLTLDEAAEVFAKPTPGFPLGGNVAHAVNMDGGGSTTFAKRPPAPTAEGGRGGGDAPAAAAAAQIFNRPTSTDVGDIVERDVTSIACIV